MEFKQLDAYVKVYELQSFSKAADEMFLSQPSVSSYINSLEKEFDIQLIFRSTKEFLPTKAGKVFYEYAKEMLRLREKSILSIQSLSDHTVGNIDISASTVPAQYILPELLGAFHKIYPGITFNLEQRDSVDVIKNISAQKSEIGFVGSRIDNAKCTYTDFMSEKLILISPNEERFKEISPENALSLLRSEFFVMREAGSGTRLAYEEFFKHVGIKPDELKVSACFNNTHSIISAVAGGLGLSIVSQLAAKPFIKQNIVIPIELPLLPERSFYIVLRNNITISSPVEVFLKFALSYAENIG